MRVFAPRMPGRLGIVANILDNNVTGTKFPEVIEVFEGVPGKEHSLS